MDDSFMTMTMMMGATVFVQPLDLVKNRMQLSGQGTKAREYKTSFHALFSILRNEGVGGIYTGLPADQRRGYKNVFNALFRITKEEGVTTLWRGCIPTMARAVVVNAAQLASYSQSKQCLYSGHRLNYLCHDQEVLVRVVGKEGFFSLWKGFTPYYARLGPHTVLTFIFLEQMNRLYKTYVLDV
ncbi:mitochondrial 2-oxoglutarate/malate carrier protein [Pundamilia nyererei]|uniref:Mitochondrial 2-oxoglutarate/malate carrier protein n=1 Tax=Pundamilia nyererei TaxID=303518 RepID=A0A9Y3VYH3_9CICH|nr:PREDICTED: mitochondrial 2-oxoglutarate/malate carrier protein-like [Pundamilia nyererei]